MSPTWPYSCSLALWLASAPTGGGCMSSPSPSLPLPLRILPAPLLAARRGALGGRGSGYLIELHARAYRHAWLILVSGFFEPLFYLLSIGVGIGALVGTVTAPGGPH